ncbi:hypothetical protein PINS_up001750 [Pythium insidiosum]|nr:hypothetical protein PINS_up001750 [Pythium insidiosum]
MASRHSQQRLRHRLLLLLLLCCEWLSCDASLDTCTATTSQRLDDSLSSSDWETIALAQNHSSHRVLAAVAPAPAPAPAPLSRFRSVAGKGLRGFLQGGAFRPSTAADCALRCVQDAQCLSFDVDAATATCYVSYTDRYLSPQAFLDFPTGVYYEWQGTAAAPELEPSGGQYSTQIAVRLLTSQRSASIRYRVIASTSNISTLPTASDLVLGRPENLVASSGDVIILPPFSCRIYAVTVKNGLQTSALVVSNEYQIFGKR